MAAQQSSRNRSQANNAIKTEDGVRVTESLEEIAARTSVRAVIVKRSERRRQLQASKQG
jgi:enoyl-CoA hydratase/carnithine racemase